MRTPRSNSTRRAALLGAVLFLLLVLAPAAKAAFPITVDQPQPVVGETLTFTAAGATECGNNEPVIYTFSVDGTAKAALDRQ